jgi:ADP-heptose:LPS heptosyltransferase
MADRIPLHFIGMYGIGDCVHQRAILKHLLPDFDVWLETCHVWCHLDLIEQYGLKLVLRPTRLWGHWQNIVKEQQQYHGIYRAKCSIPRTTRVIRNWYHKHEIDKYGSILEAMMGVSGLDGKTPDFTLPMRDQWLEEASHFLQRVHGNDQRPLMIYRPIVHRKEWRETSRRNPHSEDYATLYKEARKGFFVISLANLGTRGEETIEGPQETDVDYTSHQGELSMAAMAALYSLADITFCNPGNAPVLAQAVGTPSVIVYGGRESYGTTQRAGAHLAPTLGVDPIPPCDCHGVVHKCRQNCTKRIDVPDALSRIREFIDREVLAKET